MSFKDKHELETLPARIKELEGILAKCKTALNDPNLYMQDPKAFDNASLTLEKTTTALEIAEHRWLALESLREEMEG
jgi:ATP-binding cassette subfamily F protein uup